MAGPTLRVRKLRPGVQRGPTPSHAGHSRPIPSPSHQPVPAPASLRRGLEQPRTLSLGALPSLLQWLGGGEERVSLEAAARALAWRVQGGPAMPGSAGKCRTFLGAEGGGSGV